MACWKGYKQFGMKMKKGRKVPNCIPVKKAYTGKAIRQPTETDKEFEMRHAYHTPFMKKKPKGAFAGGLIPDVSTAMSMASQASPQDYVQYKQSGQIKPSQIEQSEEVETTEAYAGKFIDVELDGKKYSNKSYKNYYKGLI
jgi:hypothetical protein